MVYSRPIFLFEFKNCFASSFKNSLIIHKEKTKHKRNSCLISVPNKDTPKRYVQFFWRKITPNLNISARIS